MSEPKQNSIEVENSTPLRANGYRKGANQIKAWHNIEIKQEMFDDIVGRMANGENLFTIHKTEKLLGNDYPTPAAFLKWLEDNPEMREKYQRTIGIRADVHAELQIHVAETEPDPKRARVIMEALRWHNEKCSPRKYGAKVLTENYSKLEVKQNIDLSVLTQDVRDQLRRALMMQLSPPTIDSSAEELHEEEQS